MIDALAFDQGQEVTIEFCSHDDYKNLELVLGLLTVANSFGEQRETCIDEIYDQGLRLGLEEGEIRVLHLMVVRRPIG